ncbi:MAG: UDP-N-acetylmuramoyl-L-alanyl-D-glutamate--2,6-diaminopimelate ligase [Chloroflexi bacterium]|nr:MAG: UDP-N-acetylmuramoyl-L-alanyl-D-glutamate--2,6-diaminopimelate ligase [Chloroflexota bacterium]
MTDPVLLSTLLQNLPEARVHGSADVLVTGVHHDSRKIQPGNVFVAISGANFDGRAFIPQAVEQGAAAVVMEVAFGETRESHSSPQIPVVIVPDARAALAHLAAAFYDYPARRLKVVGVTGTDGKTTTCNLIHSVLTAAGHHAGMVSTVSARIGEEEIDTGFHVTTPEAQDLQAYLRRMLDWGAEYAVIESTSHGLAQRRVDAVDFDVAVITNVTHESLEYHGTFEAYRQAKGRLFGMLAESRHKPGVPKVAILNADDPSFPFFARFSADWRLSYAVEGPADLTAGHVQHTPAGLRFNARTPVGSFEVVSPLLGVYNVYNILAALAVGVSQEVGIDAMQAGIASVRSVTGRMELVDEGQDFIALVDFAHTPGALKNALYAARELTNGRVIVVFGCAGLRDVEKRPMMGEVAARLADLTVITAEDPRTEDLEVIMNQIAAGVEQAGGREARDYFRVADRGEAIRFAVELARPGDLVMVCGKGHEASMCFGTTEYPWSDHLALRKALRGDVHRVLPTAAGSQFTSRSLDESV